MYTFWSPRGVRLLQSWREASRGSHRVFAHMAHIHTQPTDCCTGMTSLKSERNDGDTDDNAELSC